MSDLESKSLDAPEEERTFPNGGAAGLVTVGGAKIGRLTFQPGWRWSESIKEIVKTESCQNHHQGVGASGRLHVAADDGSEIEIGPDDAYNIPPGHDAWVVGDEPFRCYEFKSAAEYGKPS
jgi:hypothetical protein